MDGRDGYDTPPARRGESKLVLRRSELLKAVAISIAMMTLLAGCAGTKKSSAGGGEPLAHVTGTVTYLQRIALPSTAEVKVKLVDVSRADASAIMLGEQNIQTGGKQVPFDFKIPYDPDMIEESHSYAVQARIEVDGQLRFINDQRYAVLTRGAPTHVDMVLKAVR
jgi:uncharacterized lipoprotein YbaY